VRFTRSHVSRETAANPVLRPVDLNESSCGVPSVSASSGEAFWKGIPCAGNGSIIAPIGLICHFSIVRAQHPGDERVAAARCVIAISEVGPSGLRIRGGGRSRLRRGGCG
jgi:hypothetical protein